MRQLLKAVMVPTIAAVLVACGGGGGGGGVASSVNLTGSAGKGLLIGADVKAYEVVGGKQQTTPWATGITGEDGSYTLKGTPTTNPIVVVVTANTNTTMLDETQPQADGTFKKVAAASDLTLRSFVESLSQDESVQVNPLTENAILLASSAKNSNGALVGLTKESLLAAKQYAQQMAPEGVNPFVASLPSKTADLSDERMAKMGAMMAGMIEKAKTANNCDIKCQISSLSKDVVVTLDANGAGAIDATKAQAIAQAKIALLQAGNTALASKSSVLGADLANRIAAAATSAITQTQQAGISTATATASEYENVNGVQGFINALRTSFKVTEDKLLKARDSLDKKYEKLTLDGLDFLNGAADRIVKDCVNNKKEFSCTTTLGSNISWKRDGSDWVATGKTNLTNYDFTGRVNGSFVEGSMANITIVSASLKSASKSLVEVQDLRVSASGNDTSGTMTINGSVTAYDQTTGSDVAITLSLPKLEIKGDEVKKTFSISGQLNLSSNKGDSLSGSIDAAGVNRQVKDQWGTYSEGSITSATITLKATEATVGEILALSVSATKTPNADLTKNVNASNFDPYDMSAAITLSGTSKLSLKMGLAKWDTMTQSAELTSGQSKLLLSGTFALTDKPSSNQWCNYEDNVHRCASKLDLSANDGTYKATLTKTNGSTTAELFKGATKIGDVTKDGMIEVGGKSYSLY